MLGTEGSVRARVTCVRSRTIVDFFDGIADCAVAFCDVHGVSVAFSSFNNDDHNSASAVSDVVLETGPMRFASCFKPSLEQRLLVRRLGGRAKANSHWSGYLFKNSDNCRDTLVVATKAGREGALGPDVVGRVWPLLRRNCIREFERVRRRAAPSLDWDFLDTFDVGLLALSTKGAIRSANCAARQMLDEATLICETGGTIFAAIPDETKLIREALAGVLANGGRGERNCTVSLTDRVTGRPVAVTFSCHRSKSGAADCAIVRIPLPPDIARVEALARQLGLTAAESRVASLIQLGKTNKEAAGITGLKEQTFNTYAKRVMSKLGVRGRTELAQLLTWQCYGSISS